MKRRLLGLLLTIVALCCLVPSMALAQTGQRTAVSDPVTIQGWRGLISDDTGSVGRIWTDKSVSTESIAYDEDTSVTKKSGADFLTALTALSSTSNLRSTETTPLDIVLVLDMSSSMTDNMGSTTKLAALKSAAGLFVDEIAKQNESVTDAAKQHRVAVVSYNASASVAENMTECVGDKATEIKSAIGALTTSQGTRSNLGLESAETVLNGSKRAGAKQVVVFFTDGTPTVTKVFDPAIASDAVAAAKEMKDAGAAIYTIGVLSGADPSLDPAADSVSDENKFLHAVSSNYPSATYADKTWSFGSRAANSDFYKSATSAEELEKIFEDISQEISDSAGYPTETEDGAADTSGYITFSDQLGDYMEVTDLSTLIYNGVTYASAAKTTDGLIDTYHFEGDVHSGYEDADLKDVIITVTRSGDLRTGDVVKLQIPAKVIPLRNFKVDLTDGTFSVTATEPISVFYSSALKSGVADLIAEPDDDMAAYKAQNSDDDGNVRFYANKWTGDEHLGDTTSEFRPASTNSYYFFTQDTPIYADKGCTEPAASVVSGETYYYERTYYTLEGGELVKKADVVTFPGANAAAFEGAIGTDDDGHAYFKAGTARLVYINELYKAKSNNYSRTAKDVLNPKWNSVEKVSEATTVTPHLGNNGMLTIGNATYDTVKFGLSKVLEGRDWLDTDSFTFELKAIGEGAPMPKDSEGNVVTSVTVTKADVEEGKANFDFGTFTFTSDQFPTPSGMSIDWDFDYEVSEVVEPDKIIPGISYSSAKAYIHLTIVGFDDGGISIFPTVQNPTFTNTYSASLDYTASGSLSVAKTLVGRDMTEGQFSICVKPDNQASADALGISSEGLTVPVPAAADGEQAVVNVLDGKDVTFTQDDAGKTYSYKVYEAGNAPAGYTYDTAVRTVTIAITDNLESTTLTATTTVSGGPEGTKTYVYPAQDGTEPAVVPFSNSYSASTEGGAAVSLAGTKTLTGRTLAAGEFSFGVHLTSVEVDTLRAKNAADGSVSFGTLSYTTGSLAELVASGCAAKGTDASGNSMWTIGYVAYEDTAGLAERGVTATTRDIAFTVTVVDNGDGTLTATANLPADGLAFANEYDVDGSANVNLSGVKALKYDLGLNPDDITGKFSFAITSDDPNAPLPEKTTARNGENGSVDFGNITFTLDDLNRALGVFDEKDEEDVDVSLLSDGTGEEQKAADEAGGEQKAADEETASDSGSEQLAGESQGSDQGGRQLQTQPQDEAQAQNETQNQNVSQGQNVEQGEGTVASGSASNGSGPAEQSAESEPLALLETPLISDDPSANSAPVADGASETQPVAFMRVASLFKFAHLDTTWRVSENTLLPAITNTLLDDVDAEANLNFQPNLEPNLELKNEAIPEAEEEPVSRSYTFVYTVTESGSVPGVTNDSSVKTVSIKVTDDGMGHLTAELVGEAGKPAFTFTNTYDVTPVEASVTDQIEVTKSLTGRDMAAGEFSFELLEGAEVVATGTNDADGIVTLSSITYTEPGSHRYTVREVGAGTTAAGVTYDGATFDVSAVVSDNGDGTLSVTYELAGDDPVVFRNSYEAAPASIVVGARKVLKGGELADGQFTFKLVGGGIELTAMNKADGSVVFPAIPFEQVGTYTFEVYEVNDGQANVTYDTVRYTLTVEVTDGGEGNLVAEIASEEADALVFTNTYDAPDPEPTPSSDDTPGDGATPKKAVPQTGDVEAAPVAAIAAAGIALLAVAIKLRRSRK